MESRIFQFFKKFVIGIYVNMYKTPFYIMKVFALNPGILLNIKDVKEFHFNGSTAFKANFCQIKITAKTKYYSNVIA